MVDAAGAGGAGAREGTGPWPAGARKGRGPRRLAPGRDGALAGWRPGKGTRPSRPRPGRVWPWPRRPRVREERPGVRAGEAVRDEDAGKVALSSVFFRRLKRAGWIDPAIGGSIHPARFRPPISASRGPESVTFPASSSPIGPRCGLSRTGRSRKSDFVTSLCRLPYGPLTSRASRGGHSLPGPPRDARDVARTAARRPGLDSDGRKTPGPCSDGRKTPGPSSDGRKTPGPCLGRPPRPRTPPPRPRS